MSVILVAVVSICLVARHSMIYNHVYIIFTNAGFNSYLSREFSRRIDQFTLASSINVPLTKLDTYISLTYSALKKTSIPSTQSVL